MSSSASTNPLWSRWWKQIGNVYQDADRYEAAEQAYQKSLSIKVRIVNRSGQATMLDQLGSLYALTDRPEEAIRLYRQATEIYTASGNLRMEGLVRNNIADQLIRLRRYDEARVDLRAIECGKPSAMSSSLGKPSASSQP